MTALDRRAFDAWLRSKGPDEVVGERGMRRYCPMAAYLRRPWWRLDVRVENLATATWHVLGVRARRVSLPLWASRFIDAIDRGQSFESVTASECLAILAGIPEEAS